MVESRKAELSGSQVFLKFLLGDAENLTSNKQLFHFVICSKVLEHLRYPEKALYFISRVLKQDGVLIITMPNKYRLYSLIYDQFKNRIVSKIVPQIGSLDHV